MHINNCRYYDVDGLSDIIICDLQLLFECISDLITATCFEFATGILGEAINLRSTGLCTPELLHDLLSSPKQTRCISVDTLIKILEHLRIVTRINKCKYFVPCVLRMFPVEAISATVNAKPAPLLFTFQRGYSPLGIFQKLLTYLTSAEVRGWDLKDEPGPFRNLATFSVGGVDEVTVIARPKYYEVLFERNVSDYHKVSLHNACPPIEATINKALGSVKSGPSSTISNEHYAAFYCPCSTKPLHPATVKFNDEGLNGLRCIHNGKGNYSTPSQEVWFGMVRKVYIFHENGILCKEQCTAWSYDTLPHLFYINYTPVIYPEL